MHQKASRARVARTRAILSASLMAVLLALYLWTAGVQAYLLITVAPTPISLAMGGALLVLPILGLWFVIREMLFGYRSTQLIDALELSNQLPSFEVAGKSSRIIGRRIADEDFVPFATEAEQNPTSWQAWMRLGLAYDAAGDRRRAREAINRAIQLHTSP